MSSSESPTMHRSISMPAQPQPLQTNPIKRSQEKETLVEKDYYPESPNCIKRKKSLSDNRERVTSSSQSANNLITAEWAGSTIELNSEARRNEIDTLYYHRKPYRVIEKNGRENVTFKRVPEKSWRYIRDFVTTLVRWILPRRFLTYTTSSTVNNIQTPSNCDNRKLTMGNQILNDVVQPNDESEICDDDNDVENTKNKRITFGLYD